MFYSPIPFMPACRSPVSQRRFRRLRPPTSSTSTTKMCLPCSNSRKGKLQHVMLPVHARFQNAALPTRDTNITPATTFQQLTFNIKGSLIADVPSPCPASLLWLFSLEAEYPGYKSETVPVTESIWPGMRSLILQNKLLEPKIQVEIVTPPDEVEWPHPLPATPARLLGIQDEMYESSQGRAEYAFKQTKVSQPRRSWWKWPAGPSQQSS